jgi:hypothetical protein
MKTNLGVVLFLATSALVALPACAEDPDSLTGRGSRNGAGENGEGAEGAEGAASLQCTEAPDGRSYTTFDGSKLEASRINENVGVNRARVKPFASLEKEFIRVLGAAPASLKTAEGSFDVPAVRWFGEMKYSGVSLHAMSSISYEGCLAYVKSKPAFAAAPTAETAKTECSTLMRKAWNRTPSPAEIDGCANLAVTKLADEPDVAKRWAYACTSVLSSSHFLTF